MAAPSTSLSSACLRGLRPSHMHISPRTLRLSAAAAATLPHQRPLLDFLAPSFSTYARGPSPQTSRAAINASSSYRSFTSTPRHRLDTSTTSTNETSTTTKPTTTAPPPATQPSISIPPRTDSSGNPMTVSITPRAAHRLAQLAEKEANPNLALRISVESGGCHGFQYLMSLTTLEPGALGVQSEDALPLRPGEEGPDGPVAGKAKAAAASSSSEAEEDGFDAEFEEEPAEDTVFIGPKNAKVVIDLPSLELLNGSTVDYTMELIGSQFKVVGIPGATSSCGCGTSFDVKL